MTLSSAETPFMDQLRAIIQPVHRAMDQLPYCQALLAGDLPMGCYLDFLRAQAIMLGALEHEMAQSDDGDIQGLFHSAHLKLPWILEDLHQLGADSKSHGPKVLELAHGIAANIRRQAQHEPLGLLGIFYVFEGSSNGGMLLEKRIREQHGLTPERGCRYLKGYGDQTRERWMTTVNRLEAIISERMASKAVQDSALALFRDLELLYLEIYPLPLQVSKPDPVTLNPEAGLHPITEHREEIHATRSATRISMDRFPYYRLRYGDRGVRFGDSDGAWFSKLCEGNPGSLLPQVDWLRKVLIHRGLPSILLIDHLEILADELELKAPSRSVHHQNLRDMAHLLRQSHLGLWEEVFWNWGDQLDLELKASPQAFPRAGHLIISATLGDIKNDSSPDAFLPWFLERERGHQREDLRFEEILSRVRQDLLN